MVSKEPKNEQALCKAVIHLIGERRGEPITKAVSVDTVERTRPAVEWRFETPTARFALEHTRIESFPNQIGQGKLFAQLLEPLQTDLAGRVPGVFSLSADVGAVTAPISQHVQIRNALAAWIMAHAHSLDADEDAGPSCNCDLTAEPAGVPFEVTLHRDASYGSELFIMQHHQSDVSTLRRDRIREALDRKCPKLQEEQATGRMSVLILESDDIALANRRRIAEAVVAELSARSDAPDIVLWARTSTQPWKTWFIKDGSRMYPSIENDGSHILALTRGTA